MWKSLWKTQARDARSAQVPALIERCLRCLLLVMCTYPFAKKELTRHLPAAKVVSAILAVI